MKLLIVSVEYADLLELTLPRNLAAGQVDRALVVTTPADEATRAVAERNGAEIYCTDAFSRGGAWFNKGAAIEEAFDAIGRQGWILLLDADVVLPPDLVWPELEPGRIYGAHRRMLPEPAEFRDGLDWDQYAEIPSERARKYLPGCLQLFNGADPNLRRRPWYPVHWKHAGGCDTEFSAKWPRSLWRWLPFPVLHLGVDAANWCGRTTPFSDGSRPDEAEDRREALSLLIETRVQRGDFFAEQLLEDHHAHRPR